MPVTNLPSEVVTIGGDVTRHGVVQRGIEESAANLPSVVAATKRDEATHGVVQRAIIEPAATKLQVLRQVERM